MLQRDEVEMSMAQRHQLLGCGCAALCGLAPKPLVAEHMFECQQSFPWRSLSKRRIAEKLESRNRTKTV